MLDGHLILLHGFWSSPATWDPMIAHLRKDPDLQGLQFHPFPYESPRLHLPGWHARIPDYNDILQSLDTYLTNGIPGNATMAFVTHSQGGLILQRYLAWKLTRGCGPDLARIRLIVMLSCPNEGSEYLSAIRAAVGLGHHPQASQLKKDNMAVDAAREIVLRQIVPLGGEDEHYCPIPIYVYAGRTDNVVLLDSAHGGFPNTGVLPGDHFSILDPGAPNHLTCTVLKRHLLETFALQVDGYDVPIPLERFDKWGGISSQELENSGVRITSGVTNGASGLVYNVPIRLAGASRIRLQISNSSKGDFTGYSTAYPKMLKLELDDRPLLPRKTELCSDDPSFIRPWDGTVEYDIPDDMRNRGSINKFQIVIGEGNPNRLELHAQLA